MKLIIFFPELFNSLIDYTMTLGKISCSLKVLAPAGHKNPKSHTESHVQYYFK